MVAMDAATGTVEWTFTSGSSCAAGAAIANGTVYWGTGYTFAPPLTSSADPNGYMLYAFTPNGQ